MTWTRVLGSGGIPERLKRCFDDAAAPQRQQKRPNTVMPANTAAGSVSTKPNDPHQLEVPQGPAEAPEVPVNPEHEKAKQVHATLPKFFASVRTFVDKTKNELGEVAIVEQRLLSKGLG